MDPLKIFLAPTPTLQGREGKREEEEGDRERGKEVWMG
jgi:hypothetical protein